MGEELASDDDAAIDLDADDAEAADADAEPPLEGARRVDAATVPSPRVERVAREKSIHPPTVPERRPRPNPNPSPLVPAPSPAPFERDREDGMPRMPPSTIHLESPKRWSPIAYAFLGDAVWELYVRRLFFAPPTRPRTYDLKCKRAVRAEAQDVVLRKLVDRGFFTGARARTPRSTRGSSSFPSFRSFVPHPRVSRASRGASRLVRTRSFRLFFSSRRSADLLRPRPSPSEPHQTRK